MGGKSKVNISGIIGLVLALALVIFLGMAFKTVTNDDGTESATISMEQLLNFWDPTSVAITVGGTIGALIFGFPLSVLKNVPKMLKIAFAPKKYDPQAVIEEMVDYCKTARMKGILQLEEAANACKDPFTKSALMLIVDANDSDKVRQMLDDSIDFMCERHEANIAFFTRGSAVAPAFGMIGTLVGLINMLKSMDPTDSSAAAGLGASMSVALVTTLYGSFLSNVIFTPIGSLCKANHEQELLCMQIVEEGALAIVSGANPRYVQEKLEMMLSRAELQKKNGKSGKAPKAEEAKQGG